MLPSLYIGACYPRGIFLNPDVALAIPRAKYFVLNNALNVTYLDPFKPTSSHI